MEKNILQIRNMVCRRCEMKVEEIFSSLEISYKKVSLGEVVLMESLRQEERENLELKLEEVGFSIVRDREEVIVSRIKSLLITEVYRKNEQRSKISRLLSETLLYDYSYLSSLFSKMEGTSIAKFHGKLRLERTRELLEYGELNITEIAEQAGYKSASYFCTSFKKATGLTPLEYQKQHITGRNGLQAV